MALDVIDGGEGQPPEPAWRALFGREADRKAAVEHWKSIVAEIRSAEKLSAANGHAILRLVVAYMTFDRSAKEVMKSGPVIEAAKTKVPTYNPWWTTMANAASLAQSLEKELCISPRNRNSGGKVQRKAKKTTAAANYLKPVAK